MPVQITDEINVITVIDPATPTVINLTIPDSQPDVIQIGTTGMQGPPGAFAFGTVTTGDPGTDAIANVDTVNGIQRLNLTIPRGAVGPTGQTGATGATGSQGPRGLQGLQGVQGPLGPQGLKGDKGDKGDAGNQGIQGPIGNTGPQGPANVLDIGTVAEGPVPDATIEGTSPNQTLNLVLPRGADGEDGAPGPGNTLEIGTIVTASPGAPASAFITGSSPEQRLHLTIPRGADGLDGPPGPGVLILGAGDPVPPSTPVNTVIFRPSVKQNTYYWGAGNAFPTGPGLIVGDTFIHNGLQSIMRYNGGAWRQVEPAEQPTIAARNLISTNYPSLIHVGFRVIVGPKEYTWNGTVWLPDADYIYVGTAGAPQFQGTWANYSGAGGYSQARFIKHADGMVHINGLIRSGTASTTAFTLPVGYRPGTILLLGTINNNSASARLDISPNGTVMPMIVAGDTGWFALNATYMAEL